MHDLAFADAARPAQMRCLRLPLRDYSIGHEIILLQRRNALLINPARGSGSDDSSLVAALYEAVLVCHRSWGEQGRREKNLRLWGWVNRKADLKSEISNFKSYLDAAHRLPPVPLEFAVKVAEGDEAVKPGRSMGAPQTALLLNFIGSEHPELARQYGTVFDVPYGLASWLYFADAELNGRFRIENAQELENREDEEKIKREVAAEKKGEK